MNISNLRFFSTLSLLEIRGDCKSKESMKRIKMVTLSPDILNRYVVFFLYN